MQAKQESKHHLLSRIVIAPLIVIILLVFLPLIALLIATHFFYGIVLQLVIWVCWCSRGINVLLVYSESPNWHDYIETHIIPRLPSSTVQLNWSQRRRWKSLSLRVMAFRFFSTSREFNPMVVVSRPFRRAKTYRFWKPFKDYKYGKTATLQAMESELFQHLSRIGIGPTEQVSG